jgi:hypothetical protein
MLVADRNPATAAFVAAFLKNSLLETGGIHSSLRIESVSSMFSQQVAETDLDPIRLGGEP